MRVMLLHIKNFEQTQKNNNKCGNRKLLSDKL